MPVPLIPLILGAAAFTAGATATGWAFKQIGIAADETTELTQWAIAGGGLYVSYRALQAGGVLK